jgi:hypothetical protein
MIDSAVIFAALHPSGGFVYEVKPIGDIIQDTDYKLENVSFAADKALIIKVHKIPFKKMESIRKIIQAHF